MGDGKMTAWNHPDDMPPFEHCPHRLFILVEGFKEHSGSLWNRLWADTAFIRPEDAPDGMLGYRRADIERIERDGDMDCAERIVGWLPAVFPYFTDIAPAQHESAVAESDAPGKAGHAPK
jgi:hypothetical protein